MLAVGYVDLHVEVHVLSQTGCLDEILQRELTPASALASAAEQLVPLSSLRDEALLLAAHPGKQPTQLADRVDEAWIATGLTARHVEDEDRSAYCAQDVADQKTHAACIGGLRFQVD